MADNKFGLSDALINAVRQVAENNAPLPRDERERDLARQARSNPKSLDEGVDLIQESDEIPTPFSSAKQVLALGKATREQLAAAHNARKKEHIKAYSELWNTGNHEGKAGQLHLDKANMHSELANMYRDPKDHFENEKRKRAEGVYSGSGVTVHEEEAAAPKKKPSRFIKGLKDEDPVLGLGAELVKNLATKVAGKVLGKEEFEVGNTSDVYFYEKLFGGQTEIAGAAPPKTKITGDDFEELRKKKKMKEEAEQVEESFSLKGKSLADLKDMRDTAKTKMNSHSKLSKEYFRADKYSDGKKHQAIANQHEDDFNRIQKAIKSHPDYMKKEETEELDEALTPAQRKALQKRREAMRGTKAAPKPPKAKAKAYVSPEKDEKDENETSSGEKETHIVMAARKAVSLGEYPFTFENGKTHIIDKSTGRKIIKVHGEQKDKNEFESRLRTSHEGMMNALKNPENAPPKPKGKFALGPLRPDFMSKLNTMAAAHNARQKAKGK